MLALTAGGRSPGRPARSHDGLFQASTSEGSHDRR
jgi:hypothetical protein